MKGHKNKSDLKMSWNKHIFNWAAKESGRLTDIKYKKIMAFMKQQMLLA